MLTPDGWIIATTIYVLLILNTFFSVVVANTADLSIIFRRQDVEPLLSHFSSENSAKLAAHLHEMETVLLKWRKQAVRHKLFHQYALLWTLVAAPIMPLIAQELPDGRWFLTLVSAHAGLLLVIQRWLSPDQIYRALRQSEVNYADLWRDFLTRPQAYGDSETGQIDAFLEKAHELRSTSKKSTL
jgi:hypothetical protein